MVGGCRANHRLMFFRSKPVGSYRYLQIVHSVREGKKVRQQVIAALGRLDLLEASGQLERLMRSGLRHCESLAVLDAMRWERSNRWRFVGSGRTRSLRGSGGNVGSP